MNKPCGCMECKVRAAIGATDPNIPIDVKCAVVALGEVMAECLAHLPSSTAKMAARELLIARKKWLKEPRVSIQHPAGNA